MSSPKQSEPQIDPNTFVCLKSPKYECERESSIRVAFANTNRIDGYQNCHPPHTSSIQQEFVIIHIIFSKKATVMYEVLNRKRSRPTEKTRFRCGVSQYSMKHMMADEKNAKVLS